MKRRTSRLFPRRRHRGRSFLGAGKPVEQLDLGSLSTSTCRHGSSSARSTFCRVHLQGPHAGGVSGGADGSPASALLWCRRSPPSITCSRTEPCFRNLVADHFNHRTKEQQKNRLVKRLAELGYAVEVAPLPT